MIDSMTTEAIRTTSSTEAFVLIWRCLLIGCALSIVVSARFRFLLRRWAWRETIVFFQLAPVSGLPLRQNSYSRSGYDATHIGKFSPPPSGLCNTSEIPHAADTSQLD